MKRRIRNLLALLLCFALVAAESSFAFAGKGEVASEPAEEQILGAGSGNAGEYAITGSLEYGNTSSEYGGFYYDNPWKVTDKNGDEIRDYRMRIKSVTFKGTKYSRYEYSTNVPGGEAADFNSAYRAGMKAGDKVDMEVHLMLVSPGGGPGITTPTNPYLWPVTEEFDGVIKDVEIIKKKITKEQSRSLSVNLYRGKALDKQLKDNRINAYFGTGFAQSYIRLTEAGLKKVGDFSSANKYELTYGDDFNISAEYEVWNEEEKKSEYVDVTENYEFDLEGFVLMVNVRDSYGLPVEVREIQAGTDASKMREIIRKHASLYKNGVKQEFDASKIEIASIHVNSKTGSSDIPVDDDAAITKALSDPGTYLDIRLSYEVDKIDGRPVYVNGYPYLVTRKNAYNIYLDPFEEVAHATGASYDRTAHDFMVNLYALKNDNEKLRVGSLGDRFLFRAYDEDADEYVNGSDAENLFKQIRGGDEIDYDCRWFIPIADDDREDEWDMTFWYEDGLKFFAYDAAKDVSNPYSEAHQNDGQSITELPTGAPNYTFDPEKSSTLVGGVKVNIADKFKSYVSLNGYDESAKKRYKVDDKKTAKIDKKGNIIPKKSGKIKVTLQQKVKGSGWVDIGDPIELFVQVPEMKKDAEGKAGDTMDAKTFISKTTFAPTSWKSSKPAVAEIDEKTGIIKIKKKGKVKIIAVYGEGKTSSKKKYKTKLKVTG